MKRILVIMLLFAVSLSFGMINAQGQGQEPGTAVEVDGLYTDFTLLALDGEEYTLSDYEGKVIVLTFWGWTCTSCKEIEMPALQTRVYEVYSEDQVQVFSVSIDPDPDENRIQQMKDYTEEHGLEYPMLYNGLRTGVDYRVFTTPILYFIDHEGIVVYKHGPDTFNDESAELLQELVDALPEPEGDSE